jgi:hypothetical protein
MKHILLLFAAFTSFLLSCATSPTTKKRGAYEKPVSVSEFDNVKKVGFKGSIYTNDDWIFYRTLLKAAEVTVNNGYSFFVAYDSNSNFDSSLGSSAPRDIENDYYEMQIYMYKNLNEIPNGTIYHNANDILLSYSSYSIEKKSRDSIAYQQRLEIREKSQIFGIIYLSLGLLLFIPLFWEIL